MNVTIEANGRPSLKVCFNRTGTDKLWAHHYDEEYERHFAPIRDREIRLLEIGIGGYGLENRGGESLKAWEMYFPHARVCGLDIEDKSFLNGGRISTFKGDQTDGEFLRRVHDSSGPFDVVIDDGSHVQSHIIASFNVLFPLLAPGGIYVIEDMATAYDPSYGGDATGPLGETGSGTSLNLLVSLIDGLHWPFRKGVGSTDLERMVKSVHVSKELAFIYKH